MSSVREASQELQESWRMLYTHWQNTCNRWNDSVRYEFERQYWQEFEKIIPQVIKEMENLDSVIEKARQNIP